jgi:hypothetical protein
MKGDSMKCARCGTDFPSIYYFSTATVCKDCFEKLPTEQRKALEGESRALAKTQGEPDLGFNFGAFFLSPLWLLFHGRVGTGILLIGLSVVLRTVNAALEMESGAGAAGLASLCVSFCLMFYFGATGNQIAWKRGKFTSVEELKKSERPWNVAGLVVGILVVIPVFSLSLFGACRMLSMGDY